MPLFEVTVTAAYPDTAPQPPDEVFRAFADGDDRRADHDLESGVWRLTVTYVIRETKLAKAKNRALARFADEAEAAGAGSPAQVRLTVGD